MRAADFIKKLCKEKETMKLITFPHKKSKEILFLRAIHAYRFKKLGE